MIFSPSCEGDFARLESLKADGRLDDDLDHRVGIGLDDLLDLHAAVLRGDDADALGFTVEHEAEVEFLLVGRGDFDIDALYRLAVRRVLDGDEPLAEEIMRRLAHFLIMRAKLDAARLAARAGMDLRLHGPARAAKFGCDINRLLGREGHGARRNGDAELRQQLLGLILMNIHYRQSPPRTASSERLVSRVYSASPDSKADEMAEVYCRGASFSRCGITSMAYVRPPLACGSRDKSGKERFDEEPEARGKLR